MKLRTWWTKNNEKRATFSIKNLQRGQLGSQRLPLALFIRFHFCVGCVFVAQCTCLFVSFWVSPLFYLMPHDFFSRHSNNEITIFETYKFLIIYHSFNLLCLILFLSDLFYFIFRLKPNVNKTSSDPLGYLDPQGIQDQPAYPVLRGFEAREAPRDSAIS